MVAVTAFLYGALALGAGPGRPRLRRGHQVLRPPRPCPASGPWTARAAVGRGDSDPAALREDLLRLIPQPASGAPATNLSMTGRQRQRIEKAVKRLEPYSEYRGKAFADCPEARAALDGPWQLLYSDASEITRLARLPLGFRLGAVFQPVDVERGRLENQAFVRHLLFLASAHTRVLARFELSERGTVDRVGVVNDDGNRVNVRFERVVFTLARLLFIPLFGLVCKVAIPKGPAERRGVTPTLDVTYMDDSVRISRGGDGSVFVLRRPLPGNRQPKPMLAETDLRVTDSKTFNAATDVLPAGDGAGSGSDI